MLTTISLKHTIKKYQYKTDHKCDKYSINKALEYRKPVTNNKKMKKINKVFFILMAMASFAFLIACQGPPGVAGADGADGANGTDGINGEDGKDGNGSCIECHSNSTLLKAKTIQFEESAHSLGTYYSRSGECSGCHSTEGFLARTDFTSISEIYDLDLTNQTPISCYTCHNIHATHSDEDWSLTFYDEVTETIFGSKSADHDSYGFGDFGNSNQCLQCHQARDRGNVPGIDASDDVTTGSTHWGPHYGVQGNVLTTSGGVNIGTGYPTSNYHAIENACITCHMHENNHSLEVNFEACASCHSTAENAESKVEALQASIHESLFELGALLAAKGVMTEEVEGDEIVGYSPVDGTFTAAEAQALWNYMVVYQDHSYGVHNPRYIKTLLSNSIALVE